MWHISASLKQKAWLGVKHHEKVNDAGNFCRSPYSSRVLCSADVQAAAALSPQHRLYSCWEPPNMSSTVTSDVHVSKEHTSKDLPLPAFTVMPSVVAVEPPNTTE
jgi:hypothetical protein